MDTRLDIPQGGADMKAVAKTIFSTCTLSNFSHATGSLVTALNLLPRLLGGEKLNSNLASQYLFFLLKTAGREEHFVKGRSQFLRLHNFRFCRVY